MNVEAHFQAIPITIARHLAAASQSIQVAVAWFTDQQLLAILCKQAEAGLAVELMLANDPINHQYGPDYEALTRAGGQVYIVGNAGSGALMHNKFAVIDFKHTITGSYNWSYRAQQNHENITVTTDAPDLALQYYQEFSRLKIKYIQPNTHQPAVDITQLLTRFDVILGLVRLGEIGQAQVQLGLIRQQAVPASVSEILTQFEHGDYAEAARLISAFRATYQRLVLYDDEEVFFLKLELKTLEQEVVALENEKAEIDWAINAFIQRYHTAFGELLAEKSRLQLQYEQLRNRALPNQTKTEYEKFREKLNQKPVFQRPEITDDDRELLKKRYRRAVMLCHPDKTPKEHEAAAQALFVKLTDAYQQNDLIRVTALLQEIEQGTWQSTVSRSDVLTERTKLRQAIAQLRSKVAELRNAIDKLMTGSNFSDIPTADAWDEFAVKERIEHQAEIDILISKIRYYESQR